MTARHATSMLAIELEASGNTRELTLRSGSGLVSEEMILETRPSRATRHATELRAEFWLGMDVEVGTMYLTPPQLRAIAAMCTAAADEAEARR